ncbi:MAG: ATP-binding protein, partial [Blastocatellia bacterium]
MSEEKSPNTEAIKKTVEESGKFVDWIVEVLRSKNRTTKLLLLDVLLFMAFNPFSFPKILEMFGIKQLPNHYTLYFWLVIGAVFAAAVVAAWRARPKEKPLRDFSESRAIRGLLPYTKDDAALFANLQREHDLTECLMAISDPAFRFGVLSGESGAGKSSFLQAGLWAEFEKRKLRCVYVKFSGLDPFESVKRACLKHLPLPDGVADTADFLNLLDAAARQDASPIVLLFDQFEQFFVHRKRKKDREPFVQALERWFAEMQSSPVKILLCIRGDFLDRLNELQKAMRYLLSPAQSFRLERFEPDQATEVFCFLAEKENLEYDRKFISEMTRQELASAEDGLISPVDIQVLAWMIAGQPVRDGRA